MHMHIEIELVGLFLEYPWACRFLSHHGESLRSLLQDRIRKLETQLRSRADTSASSREIYLLESQNQTLSSVIDRQKTTIALLQTQLDATMAADRVRRGQ